MTDVERQSDDDQPEPSQVVEPAPSQVIEPAPSRSVEPAPSAVMEPAPSQVIEPAPTGSVEPAPSAVVEPAPTGSVEPAPSAVVESAPTGSVEPAPSAVVESAPTGSVEPAPSAVVESAPTESVESAPSAVVESAPTGSVEPAPSAVVESAPSQVVEPAPGPVAEPGAPVSHLPPPPPGAHEPPAPTDAGKIVTGTVTGVSPDELSITLLDGRPAVLARRHWDLHPVDDLTKVIEVNDLVEAAVLARDDPKHRVVLSRAWSLKTKAWDAVTKAAESHEAIKARVTSVSPKGLVVDVHGLRGFVPASHLSLDSKPDFSEFADQTVELKVLEVDQKKERLVLSRRSQLLREQRKEAHDLLTKLEVGQVVTGTVASLADYGAFVDLGGIKGLVHLSELSWQRVGHPRDVVSVGQQVEVRVLDVKVKKRRVSLSLRKTRPDPLAAIVPGSVVSAPVTRLVDFGAFVDLGGVEGLVHLSELAEYRVSAPEEIVTPGEVVMVKILAVDKRRRRVELSIRQAVSDHYGD